MGELQRDEVDKAQEPIYFKSKEEVLRIFPLDSGDKELIWNYYKKYRVEPCHHCNNGVFSVITGALYKEGPYEGLFLFRLECRNCRCQYVPDDIPNIEIACFIDTNKDRRLTPGQLLLKVAEWRE